MKTESEQFGVYLCEKYGLSLDDEFGEFVFKQRILSDQFEKQIVQIVCNCFGVSPLKVLSRSRQKPYVEARTFIAYYLRSISRKTLQEIGRILGNRDHSTVIWMLNNHQDWLKYDEMYYLNSTESKRRLNELMNKKRVEAQTKG